MGRLKHYLFNQKTLLISLAFIFLCISSLFYHNKIFRFGFVDEQDNVLVGKYLLDHKILYRDVFSHHLPTTYIVSAVLQKITHPANIFMVIKRHREFMILWSFLFAIILTARFKLSGLLTTTIFETAKVMIFGNLFLAESLVAYPLIYLLLFCATPKKPRFFESIWLGILTGFCFTNLAALWPLLGVSVLFTTITLRTQLRNLTLFYVGLIIPILITLPFISLVSFWHEAIWINMKFYIPAVLKAGDASSPIELFKIFVVHTPVAMAWIWRTLLFGIILGLGLLVRKKTYGLSVLIITAIVFVSLRSTGLNTEIYRGFHNLPLLAIVAASISILALKIWQLYPQKSYRIILGIYFVMLAIVLVTQTSYMLWQRGDKGTDFSIAYSDSMNYSAAISILKSDEDKLFISPIAPLLYWSATITPASRYTFYYGWMEQVPEIHNSVDSLFKKQPPTFLYIDQADAPANTYKAQYQALMRGKKRSFLWIRKDKISKISPTQKEKLAFYGLTL